MDWTKVKQWAQQPTTIHAFGAVAFGALGAAAHFFGASQDVSFGIGLAGYALVHAGINDSTASKPIEKLIEDGVNGYVRNRLAGLMPALLADAPTVISELLPASSTAAPPAPAMAARQPPMRAPGAPGLSTTSRR